MYKIYKITSSPVVDFAAEELKKYLRMMMTECGEIKIEYSPDAMDGFRLGVMADFGLDTSESDDTVLDDIIHINTDLNGGIIAGSNPRSVLLAVYKYLTINGCRWLFPGIDGEFIPMKNIEPTKYHKMADCRYRGQCNEGDESQQCMIDTIDFSPKIGLNVYMIEFDNPKAYYERYYAHKYNPKYRESELPTDVTYLQWKRQCECEMAKRGLQFHDMGHSLTVEPFGIDSTVGCWDDSGLILTEEQSKYLALIDGKRALFKGAPLRTNFCMSNKTAREMFVKYACDYAALESNVDYLHLWLADDSNNHCECEECVKKTASDWYVILMNEVDAELTRRGLDTRVVFCCYVDTKYAPLVETINNPKRFSVLACVSGNYHESVSMQVLEMELAPYVRNKIEDCKTVDEYVAYARAWQRKCNVNVFSYGYHFHLHQYFCPGVLDFARIIHGDVKGLSANGIRGIVEDGSQRSFFPNGFAYYVYASTLFDNSVEFDDLVKDYFSHAYGEDWREVYDFFGALDEVFDVKYMTGFASADASRGRFYNPEMAEKFRKVKEICSRMGDFAEKHKNMPMRSQTVMHRVLRRYFEYCEGLAYPLTLKAMGLSIEASEAYEEFRTEFGKYELEMDGLFDQGHSSRGYTYCIFGKANNPLLIPN